MLLLAGGVHGSLSGVMFLLVPVVNGLVYAFIDSRVRHRKSSLLETSIARTFREPFCAAGVYSFMTNRIFLAALLVPAAFAQSPLDCSRAHDYCEMREQTVSATGRFTVEDLHNGSVTVRGSNRSDVLVRMRVETNARSQGEAKDMFSRVHTHPAAGRFTVDGPSTNNPFDWFFNANWSVSAELLVPNKTGLDPRDA